MCPPVALHNLLANRQADTGARILLPISCLLQLELTNHLPARQACEAGGRVAIFGEPVNGYRNSELRGFAPIGILEYWNDGIMGSGRMDHWPIAKNPSSQGSL